MERETSLVLLYDYDLGDVDWQDAGLPIYIARVNVSVSEIEQYIPEIVKLSGRDDVKFVLYIEDTEENLEAIHQIYQNFAEQYHCYIEYEVHTLNITVGNLPVGDEPIQYNGLLAVFYEEPVFPCVHGQPDIEKEMPVALIGFETNVNNVSIAAILNLLKQAGVRAKYWYIFPFTEDNYRYFVDRADSFIENVNNCIQCQKENDGQNWGSCRNCPLFYMASYAKNLLDKGVEEIYADTEEFELMDDDEEEE